MVVRSSFILTDLDALERSIVGGDAATMFREVIAELRAARRVVSAAMSLRDGGIASSPSVYATFFTALAEYEGGIVHGGSHA